MPVFIFCRTPLAPQDGWYPSENFKKEIMFYTLCSNQNSDFRWLRTIVICIDDLLEKLEEIITESRVDYAFVPDIMAVTVEVLVHYWPPSQISPLNIPNFTVKTFR